MWKNLIMEQKEPNQWAINFIPISLEPIKILNFNI